MSVEGLKLLCAADLHERFGTETEPVPGLIRTNAASARAPDGTWEGYGPVYIFIPDKRRKVTHLFTIHSDGEIVNRVELPPYELEGYVVYDGEEPLRLELPDRTVDPDRERWDARMKEYEASDSSKPPSAPYEPTKES